jgi:hypothetical protein
MIRRTSKATDRSIAAVDILDEAPTLHIMRVFEPASKADDRRGIPGRNAWHRLREIVDDARRDPEVSASAEVLSLLLTLDALVEKAEAMGDPWKVFSPLVQRMDRLRMTNRRNAAKRKRRTASDELAARVAEMAKADMKRGRNKRIALDLGIAESTVSEILKKKNLR